MTDSLSSTFTGRVISVNERGIRLDGHDGWYNVSKFAPSVVLPARGETVTVSIDSKGFLRSCEPVAAATATNGYGAVSSAPGTTSAQHKDRTITRLAVLKAAAEYAASKPQSSSADVLKIAACWERWVTRDDDPDGGLVDAF